MIASVVAAAFGFIGTATFTRLLSPDDYGIYVIGVGLAGFVSAILFTWLRFSVMRLQSEGGERDLRATAIDGAGNSRTSAVIPGAAVNNPSLPPVVSASITSVVAPAQGVSILGAVGGSHPETWAYGFTSAPPAVVNGETLPYTASGRQLVLLRYTEEGGWQIADVLRNPGGVSAFELLPKEQVSVTSGVRVTGAMTPDGEAWLWLAEESIEGRQVFGLFHRRPGGRFELDRAATERLEPQTAGQERLLSSLDQGDRLRLTGGQSEGQPVFGMLTAANHGRGTGHEYALLREGTWERERVPPPPAPIPSEETMTLERGDIEGPLPGGGYSRSRTVPVAG